MATLEKVVSTNYGSVTCKLYYSTSNANDKTTITVEKFEWTPAGVGVSASDYGTLHLDVTFDGKAVINTAYIMKNTAWPMSIYKSVSVDRTHSAQSKALKMSLTSVVYYKWVGDGWNFSNTASGSASVNVSIPARPSYAVTYNANGGSGAPSSQTKWYGENLTLSGTKPTRTNHVFKRWNTNTSDTGTAYNPSATYTGNAALALYAIWYPPYTVTFNANGGSGAPSAQTKVYNQRLTLSSQKPTRAGYVFKNWNTNTSNTGTSYNPSAAYDTNANLALYAIWNPVITYDANGGTGAPAAQTKTFGTNLTLQAGTPTRTGYTFKSWNTAKDGSGTTYNPSGTYTSNNAATLYAQWTKVADPPTISSLTAVRSNSSGQASNSGTYCKVTAAWKIDTTNVSGNTATVTGTIKADESGATARAITFSSGASGTSGTAQALVADCDTDKQYIITITVTDKKTSTQRTALMTRAFFIMDLAAGGKAMGIGSAAPASGLEVGWTAQFDENVALLKALSVTGNLSVAGNLTAPQLTVNSYTSDVITAASGWTVAAQSAKVYGKVVMIYAALKPTAAVSAGARTIATVASAYRPSLLQGFGDGSGMGYVNSNGSVYYRNVVDLSTSSTVYVGVTYLKS